MDNENSKNIGDSMLDALTSNGANKVLSEPTKKRITHLTHTGYYAGIPYCGNDLNSSGTDRFIHPNIVYIKNHRSDVCPECLAIWDSAEV